MKPCFLNLAFFSPYGCYGFSRPLDVLVFSQFNWNLDVLNFQANSAEQCEILATYKKMSISINFFIADKLKYCPLSFVFFSFAENFSWG